jgi:hypothetical protein
MGSGRPRRGPFWALAVLALASIALISRSVPHDGPDRQAVSIRAEVSALRSGHLWLALAACAATTGGVLSAYSFISPLLSDRTGLAAGLVPLVLVGFGVGALVGTLLGGRLGDRHPHATTVVAPAATTVLLLAICLIEVDGFKSTIAISDVYEHTLRALAADLAALGDGDQLVAATCPACANRDHGVERNARYLRDELAENAEFRERFRASPGLCVLHFQLVWDASCTSEERALLQDTELDAVRSLLGELQEHLRRQRAEHSHELLGAEADSWQRALWLTGGWPAPAASAAVPEGGEKDHSVRPSS